MVKLTRQLRERLPVLMDIIEKYGAVTPEIVLREVKNAWPRPYVYVMLYNLARDGSLKRVCFANQCIYCFKDNILCLDKSMLEIIKYIHDYAQRHRVVSFDVKHIAKKADRLWALHCPGDYARNERVAPKCYLIIRHIMEYILGPAMAFRLSGHSWRYDRGKLIALTSWILSLYDGASTGADTANLDVKRSQV